MLDVRYQIFISSTFRDLQRERQAVLDAIIKLNHIPSGMEAFPATNSTPWALIQNIIRNADYYVLIIGGLYGSTAADGVSYTEKEYDYALELGIPVLAFLHAQPEEIPAGKSEMDSTARKKLIAFRKKVQKHHCNFWHGPADLKSTVLASLVQEFVVTPRVGWIRRDQQDSPELLRKVNTLLEENTALKRELEVVRMDAASDDHFGGLAQEEDEIELVWKDRNAPTATTTWGIIWGLLCPEIMKETSEPRVRDSLDRLVRQHLNRRDSTEAHSNLRLSDETFEIIITQFLALEYLEPAGVATSGGLVRSSGPSYRLGYRATKRGLRAHAIRAAVKRRQE